MTLDTLAMSAGVFVAILPYLGFPNSIDSILFLIAGVFIVALGITLRRRGLYMPRTHATPSQGDETTSSEKVIVQ